jgi:hypothetical protein
VRLPWRVSSDVRCHQRIRIGVAHIAALVGFSWIERERRVRGTLAAGGAKQRGKIDPTPGPRRLRPVR